MGLPARTQPCPKASGQSSISFSLSHATGHNQSSESSGWALSLTIPPVLTDTAEGGVIDLQNLGERRSELSTQVFSIHKSSPSLQPSFLL